uniref:Cytochrome b n=1 Tax=Fruticicola koreana TaxID=1686014 RepID=A0A3Q8AF47_9EUPU|nr:cytochrome b [Fruticicola koreana]
MKKIRELESIMSLPSPNNISIWWNFGSLLGFMLGMQILTGIFLSMHYTADLYMTFQSIVHISRDVPSGWLIRSLHANGASMFFLLIYVHMGRGIYYQSYLTQPMTWLSGVTIYLISMATAFLGYVLPWGQMSYWGATVITNLISAVPYFGQSVVVWVWGGFSVAQATLNRFYTFHFLAPFLLSMFVLLHLVFLHAKGSSNPLGNLHHGTKISFHPYFTWKDMVGFLLILVLLLGVVMFYPTLFTDPENFLEANPMVTPVHIQPEWYFLFAYAILRSIPSKLGGVVALLCSVLFLYIFPYLGMLFGPGTPTAFNLMGQITFWFFVMVFLILTWLGACPVEAPYVVLAQWSTGWYFCLPLLFFMSHKLWLNFL